MSIQMLLVVAAFLCALAGTFNLALGPRTPNWIALALAFWFCSLLLRT